MNPSNYNEHKGQRVVLTLPYNQKGAACGIPICGVCTAPTISMPDQLPDEAKHLKEELESLCVRMNATMRRWHYPPFPLMILPVINLALICCYIGMESKRTSKMKALVAEWNMSAGRAHGVTLQWNYGYAMLDREHSAMEADMFPPGLDLVKSTQPLTDKEVIIEEELNDPPKGGAFVPE